MVEHGDRLWVLSDTFGTPSKSPGAPLGGLANVGGRGHKVGLAAGDRDAHVFARVAPGPLPDDTGGWARAARPAPPGGSTCRHHDFRPVALRAR